MTAPLFSSTTPPVTGRRPANDDDLRRWLENMVWFHRYTVDEVAAATAMSRGEVSAALRRFSISLANRPLVHPNRPPMLPYPGGRHPRHGFRDGAVDPQRETKVSIFTPWNPDSYVVADFPEAIFTNLGLTYLAHTHVPTIWSQQGVTLPPREWEARPDGSLVTERTLPNAITFRTTARRDEQGVRFEMTIQNGTAEPLRDIRVQQCVMLAGAPEFDSQTNDNKLFHAPFAACRTRKSADTPTRWVITAWERCGRAWGNPPCPCLHSDPRYPDIPAGQRATLRGWVSFFEGPDVKPELDRLTSLLRWPVG